MSVLTSTFGGARLTREDAKKFRQQITHGKPKKAARESLLRGEKLLATYVQRGYVALKSDR